MPPEFWTDPLMYQGGSDDFLGARDDIVRVRGIRHRLRGRGRGDHRRRADGRVAGRRAEGMRLVMLANDVSLRNLIPAELAKGFGFFQSKPATAFAPVAVTLDELGDAWRDGRVHRPMIVHWNNRKVGQPTRAPTWCSISAS
jgi:fumarylacetoacetate (FAA) hydrolase